MYTPPPPPLSYFKFLTPHRRHIHEHNYRVQNLRRPRHQWLDRILLQLQTLRLLLPTGQHALPTRHREPDVPMGFQYHVVRAVCVPALRVGAHHVRRVDGRTAAVAVGAERVHDDAAEGGVCDGDGGEGSDGHEGCKVGEG
jgi:hypothetical protein